MWRPDAQALASELSDVFGIELTGSSLSVRGDYPRLSLRPTGAHANESFSIELTLGWRSLDLAFRPGPFAGPLIFAMGHATSIERETFARLARACIEQKADLRLSINGVAHSPLDPAGWPDEWKAIDLSLRKSPALVNTEDAPTNDDELALWFRNFLGLALSILPVEELEEQPEPNPEGLPEGARLRTEVNRYERNRVNRANCIALHGDSCSVCGFNFGKVWGRLGQGFIHVHHVVPVSRIGPDYVVNPLSDLMPLCPNCHAMAHRTDPPAPIESLRELLREPSSKAP